MMSSYFAGIHNLSADTTDIYYSPIIITVALGNRYAHSLLFELAYIMSSYLQINYILVILNYT